MCLWLRFCTETHALAGTTEEVLASWASAGFRAVASPARPSAKSAKAGGVVLGARRHLQATSFRHLASSSSQMVGLMHAPMDYGRIDFFDFAGIQWRLAGCTLSIFSLYLSDGVGVAGPNLRKLSQLGAVIKGLRGPWLIAGDWNLLPHELQASGWLDIVKGHIVTPADTSFTCRAGTGRLIDFVVASDAARQLIAQVLPDFSGPWKSHCGLCIEILAEACHAWTWILPTPKAFEHPTRPQKTPDPDSKRSRRKAEQSALLAPWRGRG